MVAFSLQPLLPGISGKDPRLAFLLTLELAFHRAAVPYRIPGRNTMPSPEFVVILRLHACL